jgi:NitT/TauT family transport system permease protein
MLWPLLVALALVLGWELLVRWRGIPHYILPAPTRVVATLIERWDSLAPSLLFTVRLTLLALAAAVVGGVLLASAFVLSRRLASALFPLTVVLQVTPLIAIAPLILIYVENTTAALLLCAWIVAFFPILANTVTGLRSADANLHDVFTLYGATRWQRLRWLLVPASLPYFLSGLRVAGGLALVGAVVAEFTAGTAGRETGLASRILEASFRTDTPMMFAALLLVSLLGVAIFASLSLLSRWLIGRWHDSEHF